MDEENYNQEEVQITLKKLIEYQKLHELVEDFLRGKCRAYNYALNTCKNDRYGRENPLDVFVGFEIKGNEIIVQFEDYITDWDPSGESYVIDLDIIFSDDFYQMMLDEFKKKKMKKREEDERERIEYELKLLEELQKKYPNE